MNSLPTLHSTHGNIQMSIVKNEENISFLADRVNLILSEAKKLGYIQWNNGLIFSEFILALWRKCKCTPETSTTAIELLKRHTEAEILQTIADQIDLGR